MKRIHLILSFIFLGICSSFAAIQEKRGTIIHPENWKCNEIPRLLKSGKVVSMQSMKEHLQSQGKKVEFDGDVFLVELDNGLKAVFKSVPADDLGDAYAEVVAYQASVELGFPHIPPTVMTEINGKKGSLQLFVETTFDALDPKVYEPALKEASKDDVANLKLFHFVFGQWDTGPHNMLIFKDNGKTYLISIDNSGIRNHQHVQYGNLPFVSVRSGDHLQTKDWGKPFPFHQAQEIQHPTGEKLKRVFGILFEDSFYQSFKGYRIPFRYVIYNNKLWRQYHAGDKSFDISFTNYIPAQTRKELEGLNLKGLKAIYSVANGADFLTPEYVNAILERRDQVLRYFNEQDASRKGAL